MTMNTTERPSANALASPWRSLKGAARYCDDLHPQTLLKDVRLGKLKGYRVGGRRLWRFHVADLDVYMASGR